MTTTRFHTHTTGTTTNVINGVVSGNANVEFVKGNAAGTSTWVLANDATYTGNTLIGFNAGGTGTSVLQLGNGGTTGSLLASSVVTINSGAVLGFNRSNAFTFTNTVSGAGGVTNSGLGTITWDNGTSGYTGPTVVSGANDAARLVFGSGGAYSFSGAAAAVTLSNGADLEFKTSSNVNLSGVITGATNSYLTQSGAGTLTLSGAADNPNARAIVTGGTLVLGKTSGASAHALTAANDLALVVNGGIARLAGTGGDQIATTADVMVNSGTLDLNGQSEGFDALGGGAGGVIRTNLAASTSALTLGESNSGVNVASPLGSTANFGGSIQDGAGTVILVKTGTGLQTLSGANTYSGATNIIGGTLSITGSLNTAGVVSVNSTGTLAGTGTVGNVTLAAGSFLRPGATTADTDTGTLTATSLVVNGGDLRFNLGAGNDLVSVTGAANFAGAATISPTFSAPPTATVTLVNAAGGLTVGVAPTLSGLPATTRSTFGITNTANLLQLSVTGAAAQSLTWSGSVNGIWDLNNTFNFNAGAEKFFNLDGVTFGDGPANRTITLAAGLNPSLVTVSASTGTDYVFQTGTLVGGGTGINKSGGGLLTVNMANTFGGNVNITGGTLRAGNAAALGDAVGVTIVSGGGTLDVGGQNLGAEIVRISGTGVGGNGVIINNGAGSNNAFRFITLTGDATIGGANRYDIRTNGGGEILDLGGFTLTKNGAGQFSIVGIPVVTNGNMIANQGIFSIETTSVVQGTGTITYNAGSTAGFFQSVAANITRPMVWNGNFVDPEGQTGGVGSNVTLAGDATLQGTGTLTLTGSIAESGGARSIVKNNTSTFNLQGNVSYTGATTVNAGILTIGNGLATAVPNTSAINLTGGGLLQYFVNGNVTLPVVTIAASGGTVRWIGATQGSTETVNTTFGASQTAGALSVQQGTVTLASGANVTVANVDVGRTSPNTNNIGTLNIQPGSTLTIGSSFLIGESAAGLTGIVNQTGGDVFVNGTDNGVDGSFRIGHWSGQGSSYSISAGTLTALNGNTSVGIDGVQPSLNISGTAQVTFKRLYVDGRGITAPSAYLRLSGGLLALGDGGISTNPSASAGTPSSNVTVSGGTLRSVSGANITPVWAVGMSFENNTPIIDTNGTNVVFSGAVEGAGGFTKTGNGILTLSNAANNFNGTLSANGGTTLLSGTMNGTGSLVANSGGTLIVNGSQPAANTTVVNSGGILGGSGTVGNLTVNAGGSVRPGNSAGTLTASSLIFAGDGRFELTASNFTIGSGVNDLVAVNGGLTLNGGTITPLWNVSPTAGTYTLMTSTGLTLNTLPTVNAGVSRQTYTPGVNGNNLELTVAGSVANLLWTGTLGGNAWDVNSTANWQAASPNDEKFFTADNVTFDATGSNSPNINLTTSLLPGSTTVSGTANYTFTGTGGIDAGSLTKTGSGTLVLATNNAYSGPTTISGGTLQIGSGGATGSIGGGAITDDATLAFNRSGTVAVPNVIGGIGNVLLAGGGAFTLSAGNSYGGGTTISAGSLLITNASGAGPGAVTLGDAGTGASSTAFLTTNNLNPANPVTVSASGSGTATIGTVLGGAAGSTFSGILTLNRATTLQGQDTNFTGYSNQITGSVGTLTVTGGGRTIFQNTANDFAGDIVISGANTVLQSALSGGSPETIPNGSSVTVGAGTTFQLGFSVVGTETINGLNGGGLVQFSNATAGVHTLAVGSAGGSGAFSGTVQNGAVIPFALTKLGAGTQSFTGNVNSTGPVTVAGGVAAFSGNFGLGATKAALTTDATLDSILTLTGSPPPTSSSA